MKTESRRLTGEMRQWLFETRSFYLRRRAELERLSQQRALIPPEQNEMHYCDDRVRYFSRVLLEGAMTVVFPESADEIAECSRCAEQVFRDCELIREQEETDRVRREHAERVKSDGIEISPIHHGSIEVRPQ